MNKIKLGNTEIGPTGWAVIGIYYSNGVFFEEKENRGISYILDHVIYEMLYEAIGDFGYGQVFGHTYYGYSSFIIVCSSNMVNENLKLVSEVLYESPLKDIDLVSWIELRKNSARRNPMPIENQYYAKHLVEGPLVKTLSAGINFVPHLESLNTWRAKYIKPECVVKCITGDGYGDEIICNKNFFTESAIPCFASNKISVPKHIPWRRTNMIYSIPYLLTDTNIIASEAYCSFLRGKIASSLNSVGGQMRSVAFYPDYIPELRVQAQMNRGMECHSIRAIDHIIANQEDFTLKQLDELKNKLYTFYCNLHEDAIAWNRFAGYNIMSGKRYYLADLCDIHTYEKNISKESLHDVMTKIQAETRRNIFVTAVR